MKKLLLLVIFCLPAAPVWALAFADWREAFQAEAKLQGISTATLALLDDIEPDERVIRLDRKQPEHKVKFAAYQQGILNAERIRRGRQLYARYKPILQQIEARTGVPGKIIIALWGIESSFGDLKGNFSVLRSLATLAHEGRRADFFRQQLMAALKIIDNNERGADELRGSWAGAMGQCQFMPGTFLNHAVDGDDDGVRDIWDNEADIFASMANYLRTEGWRSGRGWGLAVAVAAPLAETYIGVRREPLTAAEWAKQGVTLPDGSPLAMPVTRLYYLVQPDGAAGESYLVTDNYKAVMNWNRSTYFATAVGLLADRIAE